MIEYVPHRRSNTGLIVALAAVVVALIVAVVIVISQRGGGYKAVIREHLQKTLHDPHFEEVEWGEPKKSGKTVTVVLRMRARNAVGGLMNSMVRFEVNGTQVVSVQRDWPFMDP